MKQIQEQTDWYRDDVTRLTNHKYVFAFSEIIQNSPAMTGAIVYSLQRLGKTMYALQVMYDIYRDWDLVLKRTFFKLEDLLVALKDYSDQDILVPVVTWDDAGVYGSKYLFFSDKKLTGYLQKLFDVVGTIIKGIIITTPNHENMLKAVRGYEFYRIKIHERFPPAKKTARLAKGYKNILLPSGKRITASAFNDYYDVTIPDDVYLKYFNIRKSYTKGSLDELDEYQKASEKKRQ